MTTLEELEALPEGSVIIDSLGDVWQRRGDYWCSYETAPYPASVIHRKWSPIRVLDVARRKVAS